MAEQSSTIIVNADDYEIFMAIFPRGPQDRRSFRFKQFEKAMAGAGFSINKATGNGAARTFYPPATISRTPVSIHANHGRRSSDLDRHQIQLIAKELRRVYDWSSETFVEA